MATRSGVLKAQILKRSKFDTLNIKRLYELMEKYYDNVTHQNFVSDLYKKSGLILLMDTGSLEIMGFSTLLNVDVKKEGLRYRGVFSGDTIVEKTYWGQSSLQRAFTRYIVAQKLKDPLTPFYWFLISKGYKTYLLMANNFFTHYPRFEKPTPNGVGEIIRNFYSENFKESFNPESGLIEFKESACRLREGVAGVTDELIQTNPRIAFFQSMNPHWSRGTELACVAELTFVNPIWYLGKASLQQMRRHTRKMTKLIPNPRRET